MTIQAVYEISVYTVTFYDASGSIIDTPQQVSKLQSAKPPETAPVLDNTIFKGWYTGSDNGTLYTSDEIRNTPVTSSVNYYASYKELKTATVTFKSFDGSTLHELTVNKGESVSYTPNIPGYKFIGWNPDPNLGTIDTIENITHTMNVTAIVALDDEHYKWQTGESEDFDAVWNDNILDGNQNAALGDLDFWGFLDADGDLYINSPDVEVKPEAAFTGDIYVNAGNVVLEGFTGDNNVIIGSAVKDSDIYFENCELGDMTVSGAGLNSVHLTSNTTIGALTVSKSVAAGSQSVRVAVDDTSTIETLKANSALKIEGENGGTVKNEIALITISDSLPAQHGTSRQ